MHLYFQKVKDLPVVPKDVKMPTTFQKILLKFLWLFSTARNILVVVVCAIICWLLETHLGSSPVILTGYVKQGLPDVQLPPLEAQVGNETYGFAYMVSTMGSGCFVVPLLSLLETIALAKVFCK